MFITAGVQAGARLYNCRLSFLNKHSAKWEQLEQKTFGIALESKADLNNHLSESNPATKCGVP